MKLYLWTGVLNDYTEGCAFAIAESIEDAVAQLRVDLPPHEDPAEWRAPEVHEVTEPFAFWLYGGG